jgi:hypothetical protein
VKHLRERLLNAVPGCGLLRERKVDGRSSVLIVDEAKIARFETAWAEVIGVGVIVLKRTGGECDDYA